MSTFRLRKPARAGQGALTLDGRPLAEEAATAIAELLRKEYGLACALDVTVLLASDGMAGGPSGAEPVKVPAGHFKVRTDAGALALHVHEGPPGPTLELAGAVSRHVAARTKVGMYRLTLSGKTAALLSDNCHATLTDWVEGVPLEAIPVAGREAGRALAELHAILADFPDAETVKISSESRAVEIAAIAESLVDGAATSLPAAHRASAQAAAQLFLRVGLAANPCTAASQPLHGDPTTGNMIIDAHGIVRFLDFEDSGHSFGTPLDELAVMAFRFAVRAPRMANALAAETVEGYREVASAVSMTRFAARIELYLARALVMMAGSALACAGLPDAEWDKFETLMAAARNWNE